MLISEFSSSLPIFLVHILLGLMGCLSHIEMPFLRKFSNAMNLIQSHAIFTLQICRFIGATWISCCVS